MEKLKKMTELVKKDIEAIPHEINIKMFPTRKAEIKNLMVVASKTLPDHKDFFDNVYEDVGNYDRTDIQLAFNHLLAILEMEKESQNNLRDLKIFQSAEEKLKEVNLSFSKGDYVSTFGNLNTALELVLKDKLGIPSTITGINTSNIMDVLKKHKVEPYLYLEEARKHVLAIDNKIKHQGYCPSKIDCINGIKAMEELIVKLRNMDIKLAEDIRNKIYEGL